MSQVRLLEPDLVIANVEENRAEDVRQLIAAGLNVMVTFPRTVAGGIEMMRQIAQMTDSMGAAQPIIDEATAVLAEARARNEPRRLLRVFCPIWRNPWMSVGPDTYIHDFLHVCGGLNIFWRRHERYPITDLNEIARRDPQVILLPDEPYRFTSKHLGELSQYQFVSAVRRRTRPSAGRKAPVLVRATHCQEPALRAGSPQGRQRPAGPADDRGLRPSASRSSISTRSRINKQRTMACRLRL